MLNIFQGRSLFLEYKCNLSFVSIDVFAYDLNFAINKCCLFFLNCIKQKKHISCYNKIQRGLDFALYCFSSTFNHCNTSNVYQMNLQYQ